MCNLFCNIAATMFAGCCAFQRSLSKLSARVFFVGGKTRNIQLFNSFCSLFFSNVGKQVASFLLPVLPYLSVFPSTGSQILLNLVDLDQLTYVKLCSRYRFGHESKPCSVEIAMNDLPRRINHALLTTLQVPRCVYLFRDFFP